MDNLFTQFYKKGYLIIEVNKRFYIISYRMKKVVHRHEGAKRKLPN